MTNYRKEKLNSLIREELSKILTREIKVEDALITIIEVEVSKNLETARVSVSIYPPDKAGEAMEILQKRLPWLRHLLSEKIKIRHLPKISFVVE